MEDRYATEIIYDWAMNTYGICPSRPEILTMVQEEMKGKNCILLALNQTRNRIQTAYEGGDAWKKNSTHS